DTETKSAAVADKKWAVLKLKEMGLGGGSTIKDDETGTPYVSPHWTRTLNVPNSPYPYLYSAASSDTLTIIKAVWEIAEAGDIDPITAETAISVTAACKDKNGTAITFDTASGSVEGNLLRFTASVAAASPFSSLTRYLNPLDLTLQMRFTAGNQDARYEDAGSTMNPVYVCLGGIFEQLEPFLYRVVVHTACADDLKTASEDAFLAAWGIVSSKQVAGWNTATSSFSRPLYYYKWDVARVDTPLTSFAEFMKKGNGRCGLWADFLWSVAALNGKILEGTSATSNLNFRNTSEPAFLVKDWIFDNPPRQPDEWHIQLASQSGFDMYPPPNNNYQYDEARSLGTLPGQNSGNRSPSEKIFGDHAFAKSVDGNTAGMYFDPSYGSIYQNAVQFQNAAIDAFCPFPANNSTTAVKQMAQHIQFGTYSFPSVPNHSSEKTENILPSRLYPTIGMSLGGLPLKPEIILPRQQSALTKKYPLNKQIVRGGQWLPFRNVNVFNVAEGNVHECDSYKVSYKITEAASPEKTLTSDWILVHNKTTDALYVGKLWKAEAPETPNSARFIENKGEIYKIFLEAGELHARHAGIHLSKSKVLFADLQAGKTKFVLNDATAESIDKILLPKIQAESVNVFAAKDVDNIVYLRELFSINFSMRYAEKFGLGEISSDVKDCLDINGKSMGRGHLRLDIINLADKQVCGRAWFDLTEKPREMNIYDGKEIVRQKVPFYLNPIHRSPLK
ncbi:MAG: hypothetical protein LBH00_01390, partial [Planctomycetaceae bacterium]|nr:hypothetical protein [Planctomycetaceae bacterium]